MGFLIGALQRADLCMLTHNLDPMSLLKDQCEPPVIERSNPLLVSS